MIPEQFPRVVIESPYSHRPFRLKVKNFYMIARLNFHKETAFNEENATLQELPNFIPKPMKF